MTNDFKSFQVFEEATTYTALQFFTRSAIRLFGLPWLPTEPLALTGGMLRGMCLTPNSRREMILGFSCLKMSGV